MTFYCKKCGEKLDSLVVFVDTSCEKCGCKEFIKRRMKVKP